ncbi:MAG: hypothetical protein AAGD35_12100 [Actinomycetota bacterium]
MRSFWEPVADVLRHLLRPDSRRFRPIPVLTEAEERRRRRR